MADWLKQSVFVLSGLVAIASFISGMVLFFRYENPYRLNAASWKQKWLWAASLPCLCFVIPLETLIVANALVSPPQELMTAGFYEGLVLLALFFIVPFTLASRMRFGISQWQNERYSRRLRDPKVQRFMQHGYFRMLKRIFRPLMSTDTARFLEEGLPPKGQGDQDKK